MTIQQQTEATLALHWLWTGVFFGLGIFLIVKGGCMATVERAFCKVKMTHAGAGTDVEPRIRQAIERRQRAEGTTAPLGWWIGGASIALSIVAAFSSLSVGLLYAVLCLIIAAASAQVFVHLRNSQRTRVAVLSVRTPAQVIAPYWFILAIASACCTLVFVARPGLALPSVLVCISSLITALIAWRLTQLGAILSGEDLVAEQIVDDRVRFYRSSTALVFAYVQPFVFASQLVEDSTVKWIAFFATFCALAAFALWMLRRQRAAVRLA